MKLIQLIVRLGIPIALFMAIGIEPSDLWAHPQPLVAFGFFWVLELTYMPYLAGASWFNRNTYGNLLRIGLPTLNWAGMAWGLLGLLLSHQGSSFPDSTAYLGISLLGALTVLGIPLNFAQRKQRASGPQALHGTGGGGLTEAVALAVTRAKDQETLALGHEDLQQIADVAGVPVDALEEAIHSVRQGGVMQSQPAPMTSLRKPAPEGD